MPRYFINGKTYNIPDDKAEDFLSKNQDATEIEPIADWKTDTDKYAQQVKKRVEAGYADATGQTEIYARERTNQLRNQLDNTEAAQTIEQANDLSGVGLSNPNQGAFGQTSEYFTPKPENRELDMPDHKSKNYTVDAEAQLKAMGYNEKGAKDLALANSIISATALTEDEEDKINLESDIIFPLDGGLTNFNPKGLRDDAYYDEKAKGDDWEPVADMIFEAVDDVKDAGRKFLSFIGIGEGKQVALDEGSQNKMDTQQKFLKEAKDNLIKNKVKDIDETKIIAEAKRLYTQDLTNSATSSKMEDYVKDNFNKITKHQVSIGGVGKDVEVEKGLLDTAKTDIQKRLKNIADLYLDRSSTYAEKLVAETAAIEVQLKELSNAGQKIIDDAKKTPPTTRAQVDFIYDELEKLNKTKNNLLSLGERNAANYDSLDINTKKIEQFGDLVGRNYNGIAKTGGLIVGGITGLALGVEEYANSIAVNLTPAKLFENIILPAVQWKGDDALTQKSMAINSVLKLVPPVPVGMGPLSVIQSKEYQSTRADLIKKVDDFSDRLSSSIAKPMNYSDIKSAGDWGTWMVDFAAQQGPQIGLMVMAPQVALPLLSMSSGGSKIKQMRKENKLGTANYSEFQILAAGNTTAAGEYVSESISLGILGRLRIKNINVNKARTSFTSRLKNNVFNLNKIKATAFDVNAEGMGEMFAKFTENIADKYIAGKEDVNVWDGMEEAYVGGVFMGGVLFRAPGVFNQITAPFRTKKLDLKFQENSANINQLSTQLSKTFNSKTRDIIQNKIEDLVIGNAELKTDQAMSIDYLDQSQKNELVGLHKKKFQNDLNIKTITNDASLDDAAKTSIINGLQRENSEIDQQQQEIMDPAIEAHYNSTTQNVKDIVKNVEGVTIKELDADGIKAENIARQKRNLDKLSLPESQGQETDAIESEALIDADLPGSFNPSTGEIIINKEAALKNKQVNVAAHELLHGIMGQTFKGNPAAQKAFGKSVLAELGKIKGIEGTKLVNRIDQYQDAVESGEISQEDAYEESMNLLADAIATKDVKIPETFLQKIGKIFTDAAGKLGWKTKFNKGSDVVNFIKNFQKEVGKGKLSAETLQVAKEGAKGKLTKPTSTKAKPTKKASLPTTLNVLAKDMAKKGYDNLTQSQQNSLKKQYTSAALAAIKFDVGKGTINAKEAQSFVDSQFTTIARNYRPRDPKTNKKQDFTTYIYNTVGRRGADLYGKQEALDKAGKTTSLDSPQAQQVADIVTENDLTPEVTPTIEVFDFLKKTNPKFVSDTYKTKGKFDIVKFETAYTSAVKANAKKAGINLNDPNLTPKQRAKITPYNILAEAIGINTKKISQPNANLAKDAKIVQRVLLDAKQFLKNAVLSKAYTDVQTVPVLINGKQVMDKKTGKPKMTKIGGTTLGYGNNLLNEFFNEPKRLGSGKYVRSPKKWDNKKFDKAIGVKDGKIDPNYEVRKAEDQMMKAMLKAMAEQMSGRATSRIIPIDSRAQAELDAMKSKLMFSRANTKKKGIEKHGDNFIVLNNKNSDHMKIAENVIADLFPQYLPVHDTGGIFSASNFANAGVKESSRLQGYQFFTSEKLAQIKRKAKKNEAKFTDKQRKDVKIAGSQKGSYWKNINKKGYNTKIKQNYDGLEFVLFQLNKMYKNAKGNTTITLDGKQKSISNKAIVASVIASWMNNVSDSNYHFFRNAAIPKMLDPKLLKKDGSPDLYSGRSGKGKGRAEHNVMANDAVDKVFDGILDGNLDSVWPFLLDNYYQSLIPIADDGKMSVKDSYNFDSKIPPEVQKGFEEFIKTGDKSKIVPILAKYFHPKVNANNGGFNPNNFNFLGQILTAKYNVQVPQNLHNNAKVIALQQNLIWEQLIGNNVKIELQQFQKTIPQFEVNQKAEIKKENTLKKGKDALAKNPNLKPSLPDPVKLDTEINTMIQDTKGIDAKKRFSDIVAKRRGSGFKGAKLIAAGAQDFNGLMYDLYAKGKKGEQQQKWVKDNLVKPYQKGTANIDTYRQTLKNDYATLLKQNPNVAKKLGKIVPGTEFTHDQALRVNLWTRGGFEIPGISKRDAKKLNDAVVKDPELNLFNDSALLITKQANWIQPSAHWDTESIISDLNNLTEKIGRKQFLAEFIANKNAIFSKENLNKMEVALGTNWREAMEDSLYRMENGTNRPSGSNRLTNRFNNWVNNSIGAIMFFNRKSALLQTISSVNFLNWSDNNPFKAALAFGNQPQYWSDFSTLWNSPKLKQRRSGLRKDVNEAELANAAKGAKNKPQAILSYLLKIGFTPTQLADSFAIASGGATFYRNRLETYKKQGMSEKGATDKAFEDFAEASDVAQQSADPMLISQQQASVLGRLLLAFQNTPAQVTRIFNKAGRDFINNRGDQKTNVSKMIYYGAVQGFIFASLQQALFAVVPGFNDEEDEEKKANQVNQKEERIVNSMVDTLLRGSGIHGAIVATLKNTIMTYFREEKKDPFDKDHRNTLLEALNLSPPIGSKLRKVNNAIKTAEYSKDVIDEQGWDVTADGKVNLSPSYSVIGSLTEALLNLPLERMVIEINSIVESLDNRNTTFQRIALALGYRTWDVGAKNEEFDLIKIEAKQSRKEKQKQKVIADREERKRIKEAKRFEGKTEEEIKLIKRKDVVFEQTRSEQITSLLDLGLTKKEIKSLKYEDDRVNKIIELQNKK